MGQQTLGQARRKGWILDLRITERGEPARGFVLLKAEPLEGRLPECRPGQFAQLQTRGAFLRRPISIHNVEAGRVWFLIQVVGEGTRWFATLKEGDVLNAVMPLGNGFPMPVAGAHVLLVGGGVGVAPLLYQGRMLKQRGVDFAFLLGARNRDALLQLDEFRRVGRVFVTTEDGSEGTRGFVTQHGILSGTDEADFGTPTLIQTCGPTPMMRAVAQSAQSRGIRCQLSLENRMACGVGACLCCVQQTKEGHKCVCTEGPVFEAQDIIF